MCPAMRISLQLHGRKRVFLFPPSESARFDAHPPWTPPFNHGRREPDLTQLDPDCVHSVADVGPGDALFIPEGWWHVVVSQPATVAVNLWFTGLASAVAEFTAPRLLPGPSRSMRPPDISATPGDAPHASPGYSASASGSCALPEATAYTDDYVCRVAIAYAVRCELTRQRQQLLCARAQPHAPGAADGGVAGGVAAAVQVFRRLPCLTVASAAALRGRGSAAGVPGPVDDALRVWRSLSMAQMLAAAAEVRDHTPLADAWATLLYIVLFADMVAAVDTAEVWAWRWETDAAAGASGGRVHGVAAHEWAHVLFAGLEGESPAFPSTATSSAGTGGDARAGRHAAPRVSAAVRGCFAAALQGSTCLDQLYRRRRVFADRAAATVLRRLGLSVLRESDDEHSAAPRKKRHTATDTPA
eukprot:m.1114954 g.1114954  ORF g.1114954 m.1114954 type:complete len:415 (+) comp24368_c0_seq31:1928-3172(+)